MGVDRGSHRVTKDAIPRTTAARAGQQQDQMEGFGCVAHRSEMSPSWPMTHASAPSLDIFRVSLWCSHQEIFCTFTNSNTSIFSPFFHTKEHSMHIAIQCVCVCVTHHFWKLFCIVALCFGVATQCPLCGLT